MRDCGRVAAGRTVLGRVAEEWLGGVGVGGSGSAVGCSFEPQTVTPQDVANFTKHALPRQTKQKKTTEKKKGPLITLADATE